MLRDQETIAIRFRCMEVADTEEKVVTRQLSDPAKRKHYIEAADFFDSLGDTVTANSFHDGVIPKDLVAKYDLDPYGSIDAASSADCTRIFWSAAHSEKMVPPFNTDEGRNTIFTRTEKSCPPEFVDILSDGSFVFNGTDKLFVDKENRRIIDHSDVNSYLSHRLAGPADSSALRLSGLTVLLAARNAKNFYHWHFDILPVLGMLESCGYSLSDIDNIVLPVPPTRFQQDMLEQLGIKHSQIQSFDNNYQHVVCDQLVLPRIHNSMGLRQPRKSIDWLRMKILQKISVSSTPSRKIAIMRVQRGFNNQSEVETALEQAGFETVYPEKLSYLKQVELFANASHIVSTHGAALTLLAFCRPGTVVHEMYGEHVHPCFWSLSSALGLSYYNYNCSQISSEEITNGGRGLAERLQKTIHVPGTVLEQIVS